MAVGPGQNTLAQALYKYNYADVVPALFEAGEYFCNQIDVNADTQKAGELGLYVAQKMRPAGQVRTFDPNGGDLGRGTGAQYDKSLIVPLPLLVAIETYRSIQWNTDNTEIAIKKAVEDMLKDATAEYKAQLDRYLMGDGTGVMGTVDSGGTALVPKFTAPIGTRWLRPGHKYEVYNAGVTAKVTTVTIDSIDAPNRTATLTAADAAVVAGTKFLPEGVSGASPAWFYGMRYHFSNASTGTWLSMSRATYPQIRAVNVVAGSTLVQKHIRSAKNRLLLAREGVFSKGKWRVVWNPAQQHAYEELGQTFTQYMRAPGERTGLDAMFDPSKLVVDGMETVTTPNQRPDTIDITNLDNWYRAEKVPFGLYTVDEISTFPAYGVSGGIAASDMTYMAGVFQYGVYDPGAGTYVSSLSVPTSYSEFT